MNRKQLADVLRPLEDASIQYDLAFAPATGLLRVTRIAGGWVIIKWANGGEGQRHINDIIPDDAGTIE